MVSPANCLPFKARQVLLLVLSVSVDNAPSSSCIYALPFSNSAFNDVILLYKKVSVSQYITGLPAYILAICCMAFIFTRQKKSCGPFHSFIFSGVTEMIFA